MPRIRFKIGWLMAAIAAVGWVFALVGSGTQLAFLLAYVLVIAAMGWLPTRRSSRVATWAFVASATWVNLSVAAFYLFLPYLRLSSSLAAFLASIALIPLVLGCGLSRVEHQPGWAAKLRTSVAVVALVALPLSMILERWPLRLGLSLSAPALERLALRIEAGEAFVGPEWAGLYRVTAAKRMFNGPDLGLVVASDYTGRSYFIRSATPPPAGVIGVDFFPARVGVAGHWSFFQED